MDSKNLTVTQSNILTNASYKFTLNEQRVMLMVLAQIDSMKKEYTKKDSFKITAKEYSQIFGGHPKTAYRDLKDVGDKLFERKLTFPLPGKGRYVKTRWVYEVEYDSNEGAITLQIAPRMLPLLTQLSEKFTSYQLIHTVKFKSAYTHRLYQLLVQWKSVGSVKIPLDGLRQRLELTDYYQEYKNLSRRILKPSIEEINTHSDLKVSMKEIKEGRSVVAVSLEFKEKAAKKSSTIHKSQPKQSFKESTEVESKLNDGDINHALNNILKKIVTPITIN